MDQYLSGGGGVGAGMACSFLFHKFQLQQTKFKESNGNDHSQICVVKNESQPPSPRADPTFTRYKDAYVKAWLNTRIILQHCWNML